MLNYENELYFLLKKKCPSTLTVFIFLTLKKKKSNSLTFFVTQSGKKSMQRRVVGNVRRGGGNSQLTNYSLLLQVSSSVQSSAMCSPKFHIWIKQQNKAK